MYLALFEVFQARWSDEVQEEWISNLLANRLELTRAQLEKTRRLMDVHAPGALVTGYEQLVSGLDLPDPKDRHVLAAAIRGEASVIVKKNLKDFPAERLDEHFIKAQSPDDFILGLIESAPEGVRNAAETHGRA
jgi:predicted nucleic acid-binding protein